jgi:hypothetical protein
VTNKAYASYPPSSSSSAAFASFPKKYRPGWQEHPAHTRHANGDVKTDSDKAQSRRSLRNQALGIEELSEKQQRRKKRNLKLLDQEKQTVGKGASGWREQAKLLFQEDRNGDGGSPGKRQQPQQQQEEKTGDRGERFKEKENSTNMHQYRKLPQVNGSDCYLSLPLEDN